MARGQESARVVEEFLKETTSAIDYLKAIIPCVIPQSEEDAKILKDGFNAITYIDRAIKDCNSDIGDLDEVLSVDKIVSEYPKIKGLFSGIDQGGDLSSVMNEAAFSEDE